MDAGPWARVEKKRHVIGSGGLPELTSRYLTKYIPGITRYGITREKGDIRRVM